MPERIHPCEVIAPGQAEGRLCCMPPARSGQGNNRAHPEREARHFRREVALLSEELRHSALAMEAQSLESEARIIRAHLAMLEDRTFHQRVHGLIHAAEHAADQAVQSVLDEMAAMMADSGDPVLAERACDVRDLAGQLAGRLSGQGADLTECIRGVPEPVLALPELLPSVVLKARAAGVRGFVVVQGTALGHGAILAKAFGLPVVRVPSLEPLEPQRRHRVLLDGDGGRIVIDPSLRHRAAPAGGAGAPADVALPVRLWLSIVDPSQLEHVDWTGVAGVGLYRTETLFMQHAGDLPSEQEQAVVYRRLLDACGDRPVVLRTADLGGDRGVARMSLGPQKNPYLGIRAHRLFRFHPDILVTQVRAALLAAGRRHRLRLMFPMLETIDQWYFVQSLVRRAIRSLRDEGAPVSERLQQGVLIETPSAAWSFREFLNVADFAGVGTNDLVQYFFAVERDTVNVSQLYRPEHPAMLRLVGRLARQARWAGKELSVCGEIAADPVLAAVLAGLGIEHLSVAPSALPRVRTALAATTLDDCRGLARRCLRCRTAAQVRQLLGLPRLGQNEETPEVLPEGHAVDPVCGMIVHADESALHLTYAGHRYFFCSNRCLRRFRHAG